MCAWGECPEPSAAPQTKELTLSTLNYAAGDIIFNEGDRSSAAYFIEEGEVEIRKQGKDRDVWIAVVSAGEVFGEMGLVEERPRSATARARTAVTVKEVAYHDFVDMLVNQPKESISYIKRLMERLRVVSARLAQFQPLEKEDLLPETTKGSYYVKIMPRSLQAQNVVCVDGIEVSSFPFRVGRASKHESDDPLETNHLKLLDAAPYNVSRNHFSIVMTPNGIEIDDRGSYLGTIVNGVSIGGAKRRASASLTVGDNLVIPGNSNSPFKFVVQVAHEF